jgi:hypothetical protein
LIPKCSRNHPKSIGKSFGMRRSKKWNHPIFLAVNPG